jgi:hypothetical protein
MFLYDLPCLIGLEYDRLHFKQDQLKPHVTYGPQLNNCTINILKKNV